MKILYDHQIFGLYQYGGVARYFYELANHIADAKQHQVEVFAPLFVNEYFSISNGVTPRGIKVRPVAKFARLLRWGLNTAITYLRVKGQADVDIFHETYYSPADCCPRSAKRVITVYDMIHEKFGESFSSRARTSRVKATAIARADHVICISESTRRDLINVLRIPEKRTSVVHLASSLTSVKIISAPEFLTPYVLYVGQRAGYKNFCGLLRAYAASPILNRSFYLVCFGGAKFSTAEKEYIERLGLSLDRILHFHGGDDVLGGLYKTAAALVYPSKYEGFGIPTLEAMSFDCPVVCSNTSSLPEVVGDAAELFDPQDETEMRLAIERVVSSSQRRQVLIERGRERIKTFTWAKCAKETLNVYKNVLQI